MDLSRKLGENDRLTRTLLAVGLAAFALRSLRKAKRLRGVMAGAGAVALGYGTVPESGSAVERLGEGIDLDWTSGTGLRCAACGDPIVPGQARTPNKDGETVHATCLEATR